LIVNYRNANEKYIERKDQAYYNFFKLQC